MLKIKHYYVNILDAPEVIPFTIRLEKNLSINLKKQEKARLELDKFINLLKKEFKEPVWYMGFDIIGEKFFERFIFENGGFLEVMMEAPLAINAHFAHIDRAEKFAKALKKTLAKILPKKPITKMFLENIEIGTEEATELKVEEWGKLKKIREDI